MKKITLSLVAFLTFGCLFAQTYSTGTIILSSTANLAMSANINVADELVTLELKGPASRYFALGFGTDGMDDGADCIIYVDSPAPALTDRTFVGIGSTPTLDATQNWTIISNTVSGSERTIIATRNRVSEGNYTFEASAGAIPLVWARASADTYNLSYHGGPNRGATVANLTLANIEFVADSFKIYPNPSEGNISITLPQNTFSGLVKMYNSAGQLVLEQQVSVSQNQIATSDLPTGSYMVVLRTESGNAVKTLFVK